MLVVDFISYSHISAGLYVCMRVNMSTKFVLIGTMLSMFIYFKTKLTKPDNLTMK